MVELRQTTGIAKLPKGRQEEVRYETDGIYVDGRWVGTVYRSPGGPVVIHIPTGLSEADMEDIRKAADERDGGHFNRVFRVIEIPPDDEWTGDDTTTEEAEWI